MNNQNDIRRQARETAEIVEDALRSITSNIKDIFDSALTSTDTYSKTLSADVTRGLNSLAKTSKLIEDNLSKLKNGTQTRLNIEKQLEERQIKSESIQRQINIAVNAGLLSRIEANKQIQESLNYEKELTEELLAQAELADRQNATMGLTGKLMASFTKFPFLGKLIDSEKVLSKIQKESARDNATKMSTFGAGIKGVGSSIASNLTDPTVGFGLLAKLVQFFIDAMFDADKRVTDISKNLSISKDAARGLYNNLIDSKTTLDTVYRTTKNIAEAFNDISQITGFNVIATQEQIEAQIILTKQLGQSKEEALGLQEVFALNNIESNKGVDATYDQIAAFANQNKITADGRKIFNEIAKTSKIIQLNFRGNYKELVNTVLETKKLGLTLEQVSKIGKSLLNFEQSISAELEAELITGRELNLEEARRYALNHDLAGLTKEIAKNGVDSATFASMNTIQQESIANAIGMSADELADVLYKQELINRLSKGETAEMKKQAALLRLQRKDKEALALEARAAAIEAGILRGEDLKTAQMQVDAQEKFNMAIERIKELFSDLVNGGLIDKIIDGLDKFVGSLEAGKSIASIAFSGTALDSEIATARLNEQERLLTSEKDENKKKEIQAKINELTKEKLESEKLENIAKSKSIDVNAAVAGSNPLFTYLYKKIVGIKPIEMAEGGIVTKRINNATIGEAGPEAVIPLNAFYNKLDELIVAVNKGGNVYMDSTKVGTSFVIGTREV
jgi:hypothetical protein